MNIVTVLDQHARSDSDQRALLNGTHPLSYGELAEATTRFGRLLIQRGVGTGDRVGIFLPNSPEFLVGYLSILRIGAVAVPFNTRLRMEDVTPLTSDVDVRLLIAPGDIDPSTDIEVFPADEMFAALQQVEFDGVAPCVPMQWSDVSNIVFTSGTTSRPKAVLQTHGMHLATGAALCDFFRLSRHDATALISPLFHIAGLTMLSAALHLGCGFTMHDRWDREDALAAMDEHGVSFVHLIGTVLLDIINGEQAQPSDLGLHRLRNVMSGGAVIDEDKLRWFEHRFDCRVGFAYGRTEGGKTWSSPDSSERWSAHGSVNRNVCELKIVDPETALEMPRGEQGEIWMRGDGLSRGYWDPDESTVISAQRDGWMPTGDTGRVGVDDVLHFVGRADGMIKSGGENVAPIEVERALVQIDGVTEVVVTGVPDERLGQTVAALVVGADTLTAERVQAEARKLLAGFRIPRVIRVVDEIPRLASQKIDIAAVKRQLEERA